MRLKKWMLLIVYLYFFLTFGYLTYQNFVNKDSLTGYWLMWGICTLLFGYQIITFLVKKKQDSWNSSYVVADQRIFGKLKNSLAISYVYIVLFLLVGTIGTYQELFSVQPIDIMFGALISSLFVFMISQIVGRFIN